MSSAGSCESDPDMENDEAGLNHTQSAQQVLLAFHRNGIQTFQLKNFQDSPLPEFGSCCCNYGAHSVDILSLLSNNLTKIALC
jgi:hypothetical protein